MKYSDKLALYLKGVKSDEIKALEEQEAAEKLEAEQAATEVKSHEESETKKLLEESLTTIKDLESKLEAKDAELAKISEELTKSNNAKTVAEQPTNTSASDVLKELFKPSK